MVPYSFKFLQIKELTKHKKSEEDLGNLISMAIDCCRWSHIKPEDSSQILLSSA